MESVNVVFTGKGQVEVRSEPVPELKNGEMLVQTRKTLISTGTECICLQRKFDPGTHWDNWVKYPFYPGYSNIGVVLKSAADVTALRVGDRVALRHNHRQYFTCSASSAVKVPESISDEDAAWFALGCIVQNGARKAEQRLGDAAAIVGVGPLGQLLVQYAKLSGASDVIVIDTSRPRLELAKAHGATHAVEKGVSDARDAVAEITGGLLADVVYDVTGHPAVFAPALRLARRFGKLLLLGDCGTPGEQRLAHDLVTRGIRVIGAHDGDAPPQASDYAHWTHANMTRLFFKYVERGQMRVNDLITHRYSPREAPQAYQMLTTDRSSAMGVIFDWTGLPGA